MIEHGSDLANKLEELHPTISAPQAELVKAVETRQATLEAQASTIIDLEARVAQLTETLAQANQRISDEMDRVGRLQGNISRAEQAFKDILDGDMNASDIVETYGEALAEHLGWEFTREVSVTIVATWRRETVLVPYGHELSSDDFEVDIKGFGDVEFTSYVSVEEIDIREH
jgi:predicted nuclease with TOPRIM domain